MRLADLPSAPHVRARIDEVIGRVTDIEILLLVAWILEAAGKKDGLDVAAYAKTKGRGFEVWDLEGLARVAVRDAREAVLSLLGKRPPIRGMPREERP